MIRLKSHLLVLAGLSWHGFIYQYKQTREISEDWTFLRLTSKLLEMNEKADVGFEEKTPSIYQSTRSEEASNETIPLPTWLFSIASYWQKMGNITLTADDHDSHQTELAPALSTIIYDNIIHGKQC